MCLEGGMKQLLSEGKAEWNWSVEGETGATVLWYFRGSLGKGGGGGN